MTGDMLGHIRAKIQPALLCGGAGVRIAHLSGIPGKPKQFHRLDYGTGKTLLEDTLSRVSASDIFYSPMLFANHAHKALIESSLTDCENDLRLFYESERKNTFMPVFVSAIMAAREGADALLVLPCDHIIRNRAAFLDDVLSAADQARLHSKTVYFGILPQHPDTHFGYILDKQDGTLAFHEKPDVDTALGLIQLGALWNSGIFMIPVLQFLSDIERLVPALYQMAMRYNYEDGMLPECLWSAAPDSSLDKFYCERVDKGVLWPASFDWCDIGSPERYVQSGVAAA